MNLGEFQPPVGDRSQDDPAALGAQVDGGVMGCGHDVASSRVDKPQSRLELNRKDAKDAKAGPRPRPECPW
ncbi:MAG: hypothetical protein AMXMBFR83_00760 [Phycisphaerae bacterium]